MKFANTLILAAMAAVLINAAPQGPASGPVTANAEVAAAESSNFGITSSACDCKVCDDFFNKCLKSKWCWINPQCTLSCSGDTCRSSKCCKDSCRFGGYC